MIRLSKQGQWLELQFSPWVKAYLERDSFPIPEASFPILYQSVTSDVSNITAFAIVQKTMLTESFSKQQITKWNILGIVYTSLTSNKTIYKMTKWSPAQHNRVSQETIWYMVAKHTCK